jgi:TonB family protein
MLSITASAQALPCTPEPIDNPSAPYPAWALRRGITGIVYFKFRIAAGGSVAEVRAMEGSKSVFIADALATVKGWKFKSLECNKLNESVWHYSKMTFEFAK